MKNIFLLLLLVLCGCSSTQTEKVGPWTHLNFNDAPEMFQFAIVSDRTSGHRPKVFENALGQVNLLQPEFIICVGDLIEGSIEDEKEINTQWDEFDGILNQLEMPYFYVAGNHDISNKKMADLYRARYGQPYYHFLYKNCLFLVVCTEDPPTGNISEKQIAYMKQALADHPDVHWTFVFMHQPLFRTELDEKSTSRHEDWEQIEESIKSRPHTVFSGHLHSYCKYERNGQSYFRLATTGGRWAESNPLKARKLGQFDHFTWVTMKEDGPKVANVEINAVFSDDIITEDYARFTTIVKNESLSCLPIFTDEPLFSNGMTRLELKNQTEWPMSFEITLTPDSSLHIQRNHFQETLLAEQQRTIIIPTSAQPPIDPTQIIPTKIEYKVQQNQNGKLFEFTNEMFAGIIPKYDCSVASNITVNGIFDDWPELPFDISGPVAMRNNASVYSGSEDCRFRFGTQHDNDFLYIAIDVLDDTRVQIEDALIWDQDSVEICLLALPDPEHSLFLGGSGWQDVLSLAISPPGEKGGMMIWSREHLPEGTLIASETTETGYTIEVAIPTSYLDEKQNGSWDEFRLSLATNDSDEPGTIVQLWWIPYPREQNTYSGPGIFRKTP